MDQPVPNDSNRTLLELCDKPANVDPDVWIKYYRAVGAKENGALPFRVAQIFDVMVDYVKKGDVTGFVCAAGIITHYVFDACIPMHISYMHHGDPRGPMKTVISRGKEKETPLAYDVHAEFDNQMVEYHVKDMEKNLPEFVKDKADSDVPYPTDKIKTARDAAVAAVALMRNTVRKYANPISIVKDYEELVEMGKRDRCDELWTKYGNGYQQSMAEAVVLVARLWEAAWNTGNGAQKIRSTSRVSEDRLRELYETKEGFLDSVNLEDIKKTMKWDKS